MVRILLSFFALLSISQLALAGLRPLEPGEEIVYQTIQSGPDDPNNPGPGVVNSYRTFYTQITGNAYTNYGDEVILGNTNRYVTNISVATQTFFNSNTPGYMDGVSSQPPHPDFPDSGGFLELSIWVNDGSPDLAGDPFVDGAPHGTATPGTLLARSRVPTPTYPTGGTSRSSNGFNDPSDPSDNVNDPWIINFPFEYVQVPGTITFSLANLNAQGIADGYNFDANQFGLWHGTFMNGTLVTPAPDPGNPLFNNTTYNTNPVGTSRTGPNVNRFTNPGFWTWFEYNGPRVSGNTNGWESDRDLNSGAEATIYAVAAPPPEFILGDMDGDGDVDNFDIQPFEQALTDREGWEAQYDLHDAELRGDIDGDGDLDNFDITPFEQLVVGGGPLAATAAVPEPGTFALLILGGMAVCCPSLRRRIRQRI